MKYITYLLALLFLLSSASAVTIHGTIYDFSLNNIENVIVEINTQPNQQYISKNGTYTFDVPVGEYVIEAKHYINNLLDSIVVENVSVKSDGSFVLDLILLPEIDSELIEESQNIYVDDGDLKEKNNYAIIFTIIIFIAAILLVSYFIIKNSLKKKKGKLGINGKKDDYYGQVLSIIKKEVRTTQKDIRKQIPLSEAKISLIITELEHRGLIEKIKKGRGNIIILKKS